MAKVRTVNTKFWDDNYIIDLDPIEKLIFLYFLTNPLTNIAGIYEITPRRVAFDTGIDKEMVEKILERFERDQRIYYRNGWIGVVNFIKNQSLNPKVKEGIEIALKAAPEDIKSIVLDKLSIDYPSLLHPNLNSNSNINSNLNWLEKLKKEHPIKGISG